MKANELMIGDWVLCDGKPYQIAEIGGMVCLDYEKELFAALEDIKPITLTPEILEKNGFTIDEISGLRFREEKEVKGTIYEIYWDDGYLEIMSCTYKIGEYNKSEIQFVHQLQHALRLCGIDADIAI